MTTTTSNAFVPSDPESIYRQLSVILQSSEDEAIRRVWGQAIKQSTTERLLRVIVRAVEMSQYAIDRSTEERHIDTALLESSVRSILRDLEVRAMRKIPAGINVYVSRSSNTNVSYTLPAFSTLSGGGKTFYTRYPIRFEVGETVVQARVYVGEIKTETFVSTGDTFQEWLSEIDSFKVSDGREVYKGVEYTDLMVTVSGIPIRVTEYDQWWDMVADNVKAVKDRTTIDGRCQLIFGDGTYGYLPPANSVVRVQYIVTNGSTDNGGGFDSTLSLVGGDSTINAYPVSLGQGSSVQSARVDGGANEVPASTYRKTGPLLFASAGSAVRHKTSQAWAVSYPGIVDALVLGQSKTNPNDRRYMNVLKVCLLKGGDGIDQDDYIASSAEASGWLQHFNKRRSGVAGHIIFLAPIPSSPPLDIILECQPHVTLALAIESARQAITDLYKYKAGTLRGSILLSELFDSAKYSTEGIIGVRMNGGNTDIVTYARPPSLSLLSEAASDKPLVEGEYVFYVVSTCTVYEGTEKKVERSAPSNAVVVNATGTDAITLNYNPVVGGQSYEIFCRRPDSTTYNRIATMDNQTFSLEVNSDTVYESVLMPVDQPTAFRFPKLGELRIQAVYQDKEW